MRRTNDQRPTSDSDDDEPLRIRRWNRSPQAIHKDLLSGRTHPAARSQRAQAGGPDSDRLPSSAAASVPRLTLPAQAGTSMGTMVDIDQPLQNLLEHDLSHTIDLLAMDE